MRIACLQFAPEVGDVDNNLNRADEILDRIDPEDLDLLVLPELAFTGYNFASLSQISPFLENPDTGISSLWARSAALKYDCTVIAGYPEKVDLEESWPANPEYYNSAVVVNADGEVVANYRKSHLYYTDETWALEGSGFFAGRLPGLPRTAMGICMDINPYRFQTPWDHFEFAYHVLESGAHLAVVSMAWLTQESAAEFTGVPEEPDMNTLTYWVSRLEPIIRLDSDEEIIVVFANRTGVEGNATYAGTSAVVGIQSGEVSIYGILGRGEKDLLVVDTNSSPLAKLVYRPESNDITNEEEIDEDLIQHEQDYVTGGYKSMGQGSELSSGASTGFESDDRNGNEKDEKPLHAAPLSGNSYQAQAARHFFTSPGPLSPTASESHFSVSSLDSSRLYWLPMTRSMPPVANTRWTTSNHGRRSAEQASLARRQENRWSIRSDVSVWNNQPGRPRDMAYDLTHPLESPLADIAEPDYTTSQNTRSAVPRPTSRTHRTQHASPQHFHNHSQSDVRKNSISATPDALGLHIAYNEHEESSPEDTTRQDELTETARWVEATAATVERSSVRHETRSQPQRQTRHETAPGRSASARHNPTTTAYNREGDNKGTESHRRTQQQVAQRGDGANPPILQPASHHRVAEGTGVPSSRDIKRPATDMERRSARNLRRDYMHSSQQRNNNSADTRASSRGRQRPSTNPPGLENESPELPRRHRSAQTNRGHPQDPVDLSQFHMIEEYPSPNCPVHGARSRSRARRTSSRHETPGGSRHRSRVQEGRQPGGAEQVISSPPTRHQASSRSSNYKAESSRATRPDSSTRITSTGDAKPRQPSTRASTYDLKHGPKTPVAMVFVQDTTEPQQNISQPLSSLKWVEKDTKTPITRPRSAVW